MARAFLAVLVASALVVPGLAAAPAAHGDGLAQLSFDPASVRTAPGETFAVDLVVDCQPQFAAGAHEIGVVFTFDRSSLRVTDVERGPYLARGNDTTIETNTSRVDDEEGFVVYDLHREPPAGGVTGRGVLATVTFEVREDAPTGQSRLEYTSGRILLTDGNLQRVQSSSARVTVTRPADGTGAGGVPTALVGGLALVVVLGLVAGLLVFLRRR